MNNSAALIPIKGFDSAKERLSTVLQSSRRAELAKRLATGVIKACSELPIWIVCEDDSVESWARDLGARILRSPEPGLNEAVTFGFQSLKGKGVERVMITHGDLVHPSGLPSLFGKAEIVIVPDTKLDGTNVLVLPTTIDFPFNYGPNSFAKHLKQAEQSGVSISVLENSRFAFDLDDPDDLLEFNLEDGSAV
ncbi:MAG TPA: 2-phospho-L-lactate guanylyltransferase [Acidimicrobiales bacterium]|nr:2-phospho-L-lactate guanylyltransferase [Acidimicrobiales bacterium]HJM96884.1 2-phospho-L-lactate guanylyltransferase [Acidimicrobiales bacterium]